MPTIPQLESPPRVRAEWLIAGTRVAVSAGALVAMAFMQDRSPVAFYVAAWYLAYSVAVLALVWSPTRFAPGWDIVVHTVDVAVFAVWTLLPDGIATLSVVCYLFVIVCAILRWQAIGAMWTAVAAVGADAGLSLVAMGAAPADALAVAARAAFLLAIAALVAGVGTYHVRFQYEVGRLATWPRWPVGSRRELVDEILTRSTECLRSPRTVLVWEEPGEERWVNLAWTSDDGVEHDQAPEDAYGAFVLPALTDSSFQTRDAARDRARTLILRAAGFRRRRCRPVQQDLRARFDMRAVQSWPLRSDLVRGRLFCLDKRRMRLDDLVLGEVVASLAATRLENYYWHARMRGAAAFEERVRLARDVHDQVLQAHAGTALQLLAARRVLDTNPAEGRRRLSDVQQQMERDELDMRGFVARLRPSLDRRVASPAAGLCERLEALRDRVRRQWEIAVVLESPVPDLPDAMLEHVYGLVQESVINAAKHADASVIRVAITCHDGCVCIRVRDDGRGFAFRGSYDLAGLYALADGPMTLKERIAELGGDLIVTSSSAGADLAVTLPLTVLRAEAR